MNANLITVLIKNDINKLVIVLRNLRLNYFSKINYDYYYYIIKNINETNKLAIKLVKFARFNSFKQAINSVAVLLAIFGTFAILVKFLTLNSTLSIFNTFVEFCTTVIINTLNLQVTLPNEVNNYAKN